MKSTKPLNLLLNVDREGGGEGNEVLFLCKLCVILERKLKANLVILAGLSPKVEVHGVECRNFSLITVVFLDSS